MSNFESWNALVDFFLVKGSTQGVGVSPFYRGLDPYSSINKSQDIISTEQGSVSSTCVAHAVSPDISKWVTTRTKFLQFGGDFFSHGTLPTQSNEAKYCIPYSYYVHSIY